MDKEKIITVVIGLGVGICLAVVYFGANNLLPALPKPANPFVPAKSSTGSSSLAAANLSIDSPDDYSSTTSGTITVSGRTSSAGQKVIIFANADEKIITSDPAGKFAVLLNLEDGENIISATVIDGRANITTVKKDITREISP